MSYLSARGVYTLTDEDADQLIELEDSSKTYTLPENFKTRLVTDPELAVKKLEHIGFVTKERN